MRERAGTEGESEVSKSKGELESWKREGKKNLGEEETGEKIQKEG